MKFPKKINILGIEYDVMYMDNAADVTGEGRDVAWGKIDYWVRTITIYKKNKSNTEIFRIMLHEILHAICDDLNLGLGDKEEHIIELLSIGLLDTLTRNNFIKIDEKKE